MAEWKEIGPDELRIIQQEHEARMATIATHRAIVALVRRWVLNGRRAADARDTLIEVGRMARLIEEEAQSE